MDPVVGWMLMVFNTQTNLPLPSPHPAPYLTKELCEQDRAITAIPPYATSECRFNSDHKPLL